VNENEFKLSGHIAFIGNLSSNSRGVVICVKEIHVLRSTNI